MRRRGTLAGWLCLGATVLTFATTGCGADHSPLAPHAARRQDVRQRQQVPSLEISTDARAVVTAILTIPPWIEVDYTGREIQSLVSAAKQVAQCDTSALVEAIQHLLQVSSSDPTEQIRHESRIYLLLRVLYDVPDAESGHKGAFGGWWLPVDVKARRSLVWPLRYSGGALVGVDRFRGYTGVGYDAVGELSFFEARYPRRAVIR